jgi:hypothetical protein
LNTGGIGLLEPILLLVQTQSLQRINYDFNDRLEIDEWKNLGQKISRQERVVMLDFNGLDLALLFVCLRWMFHIGFV